MYVKINDSSEYYIYILLILHTFTIDETYSHFCRKSKTTQEAQKLQHVQSELQKIDQIVASDVRLLRKTIEEASYGYMEAQ